MLVRIWGKKNPIHYWGSENWEAILEISVGHLQKDEQSCCLTPLQHT